VLDASRVAGVVSDLLDDDRARRCFAGTNRAEQQRLREQPRTRGRSPLLTLDKARANRESGPVRRPAHSGFTGLRAVQPDRTTLRGIIDWQFFFLAWN